MNDLMYRFFFVSDDMDLNEWIEDEISGMGRVVRSIESLDFFLPQWSSANPDIIIFTESVIRSEETFFRIIEKIESETPDTLILVFYYRENDPFLEAIKSKGCICISYMELEPGTLEQVIKEKSGSINQTERPYAIKDDKSHFEADEDFVQDEIDNDVELSNVNEQNAEEETSRVVAEPKKENTASKIEHKKTRKKKSREEQQERLEQIIQKYVHAEQLHDAIEDIQKIIDSQQKVVVKTVEKTIEKETIIERVNILPSKTIVIGGLYSGAGSTLVVMTISRLLNYLGIENAVVESPVNHSELYFLLYGDKNAPKPIKDKDTDRLIEYEYISDQIIRDGRVGRRQLEWIDEKTTWYPVNPKGIDEHQWTFEHTYKLLSVTKAPIVIYDVSHRWDHSSVKEICNIADEVIFVRDIFPSKSYRKETIENSRLLHELKRTGKSVHIIANRDIRSKSSGRVEWLQTMPIPPICCIPELPSNEIIEAQWEGYLAQDNPEILPVLLSACFPLIKLLVPPSYPLKPLREKKGGWIARIFSKNGVRE